MIGLAQAAELGYSRSAIFRRVRAGTLRPIFPRTYRLVGSPSGLEQRAVAATLWAGPDAVVSHQTAAALWGVYSGTTVPVHVTTARKLTSPPGIRAHVAAVPRRDSGTLRGVRVTAAARTLLDLAGSLGSLDLLRLVERTVVAGLVTPMQLRTFLDRNRGRRGCRALGRVLDSGVHDGRWASALEREVQQLLTASVLPPHVREAPVAGYRVDFAWPIPRVGIEADGRLWHSTQDDFARDRAKHNALLACGWRILRVTWQDVREDPGAVIAETERLLGASLIL